MKWILFLVGLVLVGVAAAGFLAGVDLLTTEIGALYATCSAVALAAGLIFLALGALTYRIDALPKALLRQNSSETARHAPPNLDFAPPVAVEPRAAAEQTPVPGPAEESPQPVEAPALATTESEAEAPKLVGRYSAGGADYQIYSDGSIEAHTGQGDFRFASMSEFKAYVAAKRG